MVAIAGAAGMIVRNTSLTAPNLTLPKIQDVTITRTPATTELFTRSTCSVGQASTHAEIENTVTWQLDYVSPAFDGVILSAFMDQGITTTATNITIPTAVCIALSANTATVTGLTVDQPVQLSQEETYNQIQFVQTTSAPAAVNEFQVTANTITFEATVTTGNYVATYESSQSLNFFIGGPAALAPYGSREFLGAIQGLAGTSETYVFWAPAGLPTGARSLATANDTIDSSFKLSTISGWNLPILFWRASQWAQAIA